MKILAFLLAGIGLIFLFEYLIKRYPKKKWLKKWKIRGPIVIVLVTIVLIGIEAFLKPDMHCRVSHKTETVPPISLVTARDYFDQGNYDFDIGDCKRAIDDYSQSLRLDPLNARAFNNRGYTYMRKQEYAKALADFNKAIEISPDYANARMNRGDIYNFYYNIDRKKAIEDYDRVIDLGGVEVDSSRSVCGHRAIAIKNGLSISTYIDLVTKPQSHGCTMSTNEVE